MVLKEERTLTDPGLISTFILNSPASRTVKEYIFVGDEPSVCHFVMAAGVSLGLG